MAINAEKVQQINKSVKNKITGLNKRIGEMRTGGAVEEEQEVTRLTELLEFWNMGLEGTIPKEWEHYLDEIDPEYSTYLRLTKKFNRS